LSSSIFENPVKNTKCGHSFSKLILKEYLEKEKRKKNNLVSCPIAGCNNKNIKFEDFVEDFETEAVIKKVLKEREIEKKKLTQGAIDLD
jgi:SUMO ligase MMS21 Smc5/6 complex component